MTTPQQLEEEMLSNPVRSLQYMLRRLAGKYNFLPQLALDGIFGERTLEAVMLFQRELAPPVTGVVDQRTWDAIRDAWINLERESAPPRTLRIFPGEGYQVQPGMSGASMILPQTMFQLLRQRLEGIAEGDADGVHGDASVQNTLWLQNLAQLEEMLQAEGPIGRKLDFLVQEINRETNTIGSKAQDVEIARVVVDVKAEIEKIREQIQNIE